MLSPSEVGNVAANQTKRAGLNPLNLLRGLVGRKPPIPRLPTNLPVARPAAPFTSPSGLLQYHPNRVPIAAPLSRGIPTAAPANLPVAQPVVPAPNTTTMYRGLQQPFRGLSPATIQAEPTLERAAEQYMARNGTVGLTQQPFYQQLSSLRRPQYFANSPDVASRFGPNVYRLQMPRQVANATPRLPNTGGQVASAYDATTLQGILNRPDVSWQRIRQAVPLNPPVAQAVPPVSSGSLHQYLPPAAAAGGAGALAYAASR